MMTSRVLLWTQLTAATQLCQDYEAGTQLCQDYDLRGCSTAVSGLRGFAEGGDRGMSGVGLDYGSGPPAGALDCPSSTSTPSLPAMPSPCVPLQ